MPDSPKREIEECPSCHAAAGKWYKNKIFLSVSILSIICVLSYFFLFLEPFRKSILMYISKIWWAVLLGLVLGGMIDHFVPREYISHVLAKRRKRTVFYAVGLVFLMSACSQGILEIGRAHV